MGGATCSVGHAAVRLGMLVACVWIPSCAGVIVSGASLPVNLAAQLLVMACALGLLDRAAWPQLIQVLLLLLLGTLCIVHAVCSPQAFSEDQLSCLACLCVSETTWLATRKAHPSHFHTTVQAFFSACAKMCVRELRKTDTANVSVFYLSFSSTVFAIIALTVSWLVGGAGVRIPTAPVDWGLFALVGKPFSGMDGCASRVVHCTDSTALAVRHSLGSCLI